MWSCYLIQTRTGQIGPRIHPSTASWSMTINETETLDLTLMKEDIPKFDSPNWFEPWWTGALLMYNNAAIFAGPLVSRPKEGFNDISMAFSGLRALLAKRSCVSDMTNWANLSNSDLVKDWHYIPPSNTSYATIARNVVENSLKKLGGDLPIEFMVPPSYVTDPTHDAAGVFIAPEDRPHYRRFAGYEGLNNNVDLILADLSDLENGPDIMFRPVIHDKEFRVVWQMWTGLHDDHPEIPQTSSPVWDTTSHGGFIPDLQVQYSGKDMTNRAFAIGQNGSGGGSLIAMSEDRSLLDDGYPLLESMETFGGADNKARITDKSRTILIANKTPNHQINGTVRADGAQPLGTFWPGDYGILVTRNWYGISTGEAKAKVLTVSGNLTDDVELSFKEM